MFEDVIATYLNYAKRLLNQPRYNFADATSKQVPKLSGVYLIHNLSSKELIYAGRSKNLRVRLLQQHKKGNIGGSQFRKSLGQKYNLDDEPKISDFISRNCAFQFLPIEEFDKMVRLEHFITAVLVPKLNIELKQ